MFIVEIKEAEEVILQNYDVLVDVVLFGSNIVSNFEVCKLPVEQVFPNELILIFVLKIRGHLLMVKNKKVLVKEVLYFFI